MNIMGKSAIGKQLADKHNLKFIDLRLTELDPTDLHGLPNFDLENNKSKFIPFDTFPLQGDELPKGYKGWLIFLDEFNSANHSVQSAAYKLVLDRMVGQHKLHDKVCLIAAGNLDTDNAITTTMSSALISRFAHFYAELSNEDWLEWASTSGIDSRITSYINFKPLDLYTFNPDSELPYASPRTWEMVSKCIADTKVTSDSVLLLESLLGVAVARNFVTYCKLFKNLPSFADILANPDNIEIGKDIGTQWAILGMVTYSIDETNQDKCEVFLRRLPMELQIVALKEIKNRQPKVFTKLTNWKLAVSKDLEL